MRKKKPFRILEERLKYHFIVIELFKRRKIFSFGMRTSIGDGGIGHPEQGAYRSYLFIKQKSRPAKELPPRKRVFVLPLR
jgi:hypothetical protein